MIETVATGLLGSLFGGLFRLAPEVLKFFDAKNERKHELDMFTLQTQLEQVKGDYKMEEKYVDYSVANVQAVQEAFKTEAEVASHTYAWVGALISLPRPLITITIFGLYLVFKMTMLFQGLDDGVPWKEVVTILWTIEDWAILNMILSFYFVSRSISKYQKS